MKPAAISNWKMCGWIYIFPIFSLSYKIPVYRIILYEILAVLVFFGKATVSFCERFCRPRREKNKYTIDIKRISRLKYKQITKSEIISSLEGGNSL